MTAGCSGYHDFGHMGEHLVLTPGDGEVMEGQVGAGGVCIKGVG